MASYDHLKSAEARAQVKSLLSAAKFKKLDLAIVAIESAFNDQALAQEFASELLADEPSEPARAPQASSRAPDKPQAPQVSPQRSHGPGKPPPASGSRCKHSDSTKGPCQREPHEGGRHRYAGDARASSVTPVFSDQPPPRPRKDVDGKALRKGSPVTYVGNGQLPTGWSGKVEEFTDDGKALVYGEHKKAPASEQVLPLDQLRWTG